MTEKDLRYWCKKNVVSVEEKQIPYAKSFVLKRAKDKLNVNIYHTGKLLIQGKESSLKNQVERFFGQVPSAHKKESEIEHHANIWIGADESGKGDFFGPLVVACALVKREQVAGLKKQGFQDSKKITDEKIKELFSIVQTQIPFKVNVLLPAAYNEEYEKYGNLNSMLSDLHLMTIKKQLTPEVELVLVDQFMKNEQKMKRDFNSFSKIKFLQQTKAERDMAVAVASVIARYYFVDALEKLSHTYALELPKGAGPRVEKQASYIKETMGAEILKNIAKLHFKTMDKI